MVSFWLIIDKKILRGYEVLEVKEVGENSTWGNTKTTPKPKINLSV